MSRVMSQVGVAIAKPDATTAVHLLGTALLGGLLAVAPLAFGMMAIGLSATSPRPASPVQ